MLLVYFLFRNVFLDFGIRKIEDKLHKKGLNLSLHAYRFNALRSIELNGLLLTHENDSLQPILKSDFLRFRIAPLWGILGKGWIQEVEMGKLLLHYSDRLPLQANADSDTDHSKKDPANQDPEELLELAKDVLQGLPNEVKIGEIRLEVSMGETMHRLFLKDFQWENEALQTELIVMDGTSPQVLSIRGTLDPESLQGKLNLRTAGKVPFAYSLFGGNLAFKEISCAISQVQIKKQALHIDLKGNIDHLGLDYRRLSDTLIQIEELKGATTIKITSNYLEVDSQSRWQLNALNFNAGFQYPTRDSTAQRWGVFKIPLDQGKHVFSSLPTGLFKHTSGIRILGSFAHRFYVSIDPVDLERTHLEADVSYSETFKVSQWGEAHPNKLNSSFLHDHYDGDQLQSSFVIGPSNPFYTPITEISPLLIESTLRSEDPSYFGHKGFYLEAFEEALKANIREKRFARGGSTIPMQLVKNVYLNKEKTLARKIEEILLVWLIEHERAVSKQRMLEVYFNLIEWGPGIYGVGSASRFYFGKHPSQLDIGESCYLSSLIPAPRKALWSVDSTGSVSPRWTRFTKLKNRIIRLDSTRFSEEDFDIKVNAFRKF